MNVYFEKHFDQDLVRFRFMKERIQKITQTFMIILLLKILFD